LSHEPKHRCYRQKRRTGDEIGSNTPMVWNYYSLYSIRRWQPRLSGDHSIFRTGAAFAPIFASFRALLGDEIYELAQAHADRNQGAYLASLLAPDSGWELYVAEESGTAAPSMGSCKACSHVV
jgi:hypothetical protein